MNGKKIFYFHDTLSPTTIYICISFVVKREFFAKRSRQDAAAGTYQHDLITVARPLQLIMTSCISVLVTKFILVIKIYIYPHPTTSFDELNSVPNFLGIRAKRMNTQLAGEHQTTKTSFFSSRQKYQPLVLLKSIFLILVKFS